METVPRNRKTTACLSRPAIWRSATQTESGIYPEGPRPLALSKDSQSGILLSLTKCENGG